MALFLNDIYDSAAKSTQTDVLYLDFRKAFDTIPHNKLLEKLYIQYNYLGEKHWKSYQVLEEILLQ